MKAIFLTQRLETIDGVYSPETKQRIEGFVGQIGRFTPDMLDEHASELADTEMIFSTWGMPAISGDDIARLFPSLKVVFYGAGTVQGFARPFLEKNITVCSAWQANAIPVVEYTTAAIIMANKGFRLMQQTYTSTHTKPRMTYPGNFACKVGLIGFGAIGRRVAAMLKAYTVDVLAYDPFVSDEVLNANGAKRASLEEIFTECQTISNHLPNNDKTQGMLTYDLFSRMKPNATFINTGRGAQLIEDDLIRALNESPDRTAILDVTWPEPPESDSPLWDMPNVIMTPHIAGSLGNEVMRMGEYMADECERYINGEQMLYSVSIGMLETMA